MPNKKLALFLSAIAMVGCTSAEEKIVSELSRRFEQARAEMQTLLKDLESGECKAVFDRGELSDPHFMSGRLEDGFDVPYNIYCEKNGEYPLTAIVRYDEMEWNQKGDLEFQGTYVTPDKSIGATVYGVEKGDETGITNLNGSQDKSVINCTKPAGSPLKAPLDCKQFPFRRSGQIQLQASVQQEILLRLAEQHRDLTRRLILKTSKIAPNPPYRITIRRGKDGKPESVRKEF